MFQQIILYSLIALKINNDKLSNAEHGKNACMKSHHNIAFVMEA